MIFGAPLTASLRSRSDAATGDKAYKRLYWGVPPSGELAASTLSTFLIVKFDERLYYGDYFRIIKSSSIGSCQSNK